MNAFGQLGICPGMKSCMVAHVDDIGSGRTQATTQLYRLVDGLMGGMGLLTQPVHDEEFEVLQQLQFCLWHGLHVGDISHVTDAVPQDRQLAMHHLKDRDLHVTEGEMVMGVDFLQLELGHTWIDVSHQTVRQAFTQVPGGIRICIQREFLQVAEGTQVINAAHMVVVLMGDETGIDGFAHTDVKHLFAEVGAAIYQKGGFLCLEECGATQSSVAGV